MKCAGGCGRELGRDHTYCSPGCRERFDRLLAHARVVAQRADEHPDPGLTRLQCTPQERRLIAVLRDAGAAGATTAQLAQPEVCGVSAAKRVYDARHKHGFDIEIELERRGSFRYWLRGEPGTAIAALAPVAPTVPTQSTPSLLNVSRSTPYGAYDDFNEDEAA